MIDVQVSKSRLSPGESISGKVAWQDLSGAKELEVRLIWFTQGKGTRDYQVVQQKNLPAAGESGACKFQFTAPSWPHSFSGQYISLRWAIEVVHLPSEEATQVDLIIGPDGEETILPQLDQLPQ